MELSESELEVHQKSLLHFNNELTSIGDSTLDAHINNIKTDIITERKCMHLCEVLSGKN